ncbi:hypothetical protein ATANTOWER_008876, partial [Ataeniobius toweri]|nr:hypothetical protein [Ataeniobius toweri]
ISSRTVNFLEWFSQPSSYEFAVPSHETFVLTTTDRIVVDIDKFGKLKDNSTLYLLQNKDQFLPASIKEEIYFVPHYNTLIKSGTNEYFSEGQKSLRGCFVIKVVLLNW